MSTTPEPLPVPARPPQLATPVQYLPGVGPQRAVLLERLGIRTAGDALFLFPRDYERPGQQLAIDQLVEGTEASIVGTVTEIEHRLTASGKSMLGVLVEDGSEAARLLFFNQPYRAAQIQRGNRILASGEPRRSGFRMEFVHPRIALLGDDESPPAGGILPVYPLTEGVRQRHMRKIFGNLIPLLADEVPEVLPESLRQAMGLPGIAEALRAIHQPDDEKALAAARRRFIFQELFVLQLALAMRRRRVTTLLRSPPLPPSPEIDARIRQRFPFDLTADQRRAIEEVGTDLARQFPMNRLVQGDVGSGKTVVAQYAMLLAVAHRHQAVLMAPTDILARQHHRTFSEALRASRVRVGLLSGTLTAAERREVLAATAAGDIDVLVGTHALLHGEIAFARLGLVVIDEQHKFGVRQRAQLRSGGLDPHYLVLSATPIPRTMAMTLFGDLDVSTLREKPPGRGTVHTYLSKDGWRERWWQFVAARLEEGRQAYVVTPRVARAPRPEAETSGAGAAETEGDPGAEALEETASPASGEDPSAATEVFRQLAEGPLAGFRVGLLHGRMSPEEKNEAMRRFVEGRTQVLVATTVIEVGIDVPNATVMTILGAERFGLAQLHQLRGRVCRGRHPGYVCLFTDSEGSPEEHERLRALAETDDGFALAETDFRMRGPGDLLGTRQSGLPPLRIADLLRDAPLLETARELARTLIDEDPQLQAAGYERLRAQVLRRYGEALDLGDVA